MIEKKLGIKSLLIKSAGDREAAGELDQRAHKVLGTIWQTVKQTTCTSTTHCHPAGNGECQPHHETITPTLSHAAMMLIIS